MKILDKISKPIILPHWLQDLFLAIPRMIRGFLLTSNFGASKFGLPWSPIDTNLGLFQVAFWFPKEVSHYGGILAVFPIFFAWIYSILR